MPHWPNNFPTETEDWGVNWDYVFGRDVKGSVDILIHYLRGVAGVYEDSFHIPSSYPESDNQCVIVGSLYAPVDLCQKSSIVQRSLHLGFFQLLWT